MIKAVLIDKDGSSRCKTRTILEQQNIKVLSEYSSANDALLNMKEINPNAIFSSLKTDGMDAFQLFSELRNKKSMAKVILAENGDDAVKAFDYDVSDYLLKPLQTVRLSKTIDKISALIGGNTDNGSELGKGFSKRMLAVKTGNKISFIDKKEILYILASGHYVEIFMEKKKHLLRRSLTKIQHQLDAQTFVRIHRSRIINTNFIKEVVFSEFGDIDISLTNNELVRVGKSYKKGFQTMIGI